MISGGDILNSGGWVGIALCVLFAAAQLAQYVQKRRASPSGTVTDLATVNASLVRSVDAERAENTRLRDRLAKAEARIDELEEKLDRERDEHESQLAALRAEIDAERVAMNKRFEEMSQRLADMSAQHKKETA